MTLKSLRKVIIDTRYMVTCNTHDDHYECVIFDYLGDDKLFRQAMDLLTRWEESNAVVETVGYNKKYEMPNISCRICKTSA